MSLQQMHHQWHKVEPRPASQKHLSTSHKNTTKKGFKHVFAGFYVIPYIFRQFLKHLSSFPGIYAWIQVFFCFLDPELLKLRSNLYRITTWTFSPSNDLQSWWPIFRGELLVLGRVTANGLCCLTCLHLLVDSYFSGQGTWPSDLKAWLKLKSSNQSCV